MESLTVFIDDLRNFDFNFSILSLTASFSFDALMTALSLFDHVQIFFVSECSIVYLTSLLLLSEGFVRSLAFFSLLINKLWERINFVVSSRLSTCSFPIGQNFISAVGLSPGKITFSYATKLAQNEGICNQSERKKIVKIMSPKF